MSDSSTGDVCEQGFGDYALGSHAISFQGSGRSRSSTVFLPPNFYFCAFVAKLARLDSK